MPGPAPLQQRCWSGVSKQLFGQKHAGQDCTRSAAAAMAERLFEQQLIGVSASSLWGANMGALRDHNGSSLSILWLP